MATMQRKHASACILCDSNCGILITLDGSKFAKIQGHKAHPTSEGYTCQKALRLDHYQNHADRLTHPLKRKPDGSFEKISWEQAISEIAAKLIEIRDTHSGRALAYYGGGGQGNHMQGGLHGGFLRKAMGTRFAYSALAQEKTGGFWLAGKMYGRQDSHVTADQIEHADYVLFLGTNPWQSHGFPRARITLKAIASDPNRTMVVVDPRRTKTAEMADIHMAVRPGQDAFLMAALIGVLVQEDLVDHEFLDRRTTGAQDVMQAFAEIPVEVYADRAGIEIEVVRKVARGLSAAKSAVIRHDLGFEQSLHSTLNIYLEYLTPLMTGHFGREGTNVFHYLLAPLITHSEAGADGDYEWRTAVTGMMPIAGLYPPNILPREIDSDHPDRLRGLIVDSGNILNSTADTTALEAAVKKLELMVTIDVAMTETARLSHYVLPASSQFEKWEASFFNFGFPRLSLQVRQPIVPATGETLPESEIYRRLVTAMGEKTMAPIPEKKFAGLLDDQARLALAPLYMLVRRYATTQSAAVARAGVIAESGETPGDALFRKIITSPSGTDLSVHEMEDMWALVRHADGRIRLVVPEMLQELKELADELKQPITPAGFPLVLMAGERRSYNANQIYRSPHWRKTEQEGGLRIHPEDAKKYNLTDGVTAVCESKRAGIDVVIEYDESAQPGFVSLPHGYGMQYPDEQTGERRVFGPRINMLTASEDCDPLAKTPYHKFVPVRLLAKQ